MLRHTMVSHAENSRSTCSVRVAMQFYYELVELPFPGSVLFLLYGDNVTLHYLASAAYWIIYTMTACDLQKIIDFPNENV